MAEYSEVTLHTSLINSSDRSLEEFLSMIQKVRTGEQIKPEEKQREFDQNSFGKDYRRSTSVRTSNRRVKVFSIGFTHLRAEEFFETLKSVNIRRLVDIRLNNWSQFAGYTKKTDLPYLLKQICKAEYRHELLLAPSRELLDAYKKDNIGWQEYERRFLSLLAERKIETVLPPEIFAIPTALLCYEPTADCCHRRLVLDYLQEKWGCLKIIHL